MAKDTSSLEESQWLARAKQGKVPRHIGIIMDGNGRWAQRNGLSRNEGHRAGVESVKRCVPALLELGVKYCSLYVFSTENWSRPQDEVQFLMELIIEWASKDRQELVKRGTRVIPVGRWRDLPAPVVAAISTVMRDTAGGTRLTLLPCINYGGRQEILDAIKKASAAFAGDQSRMENLSEEEFRQYLYFPEAPDPDLIIRTSGEERLSNFLLWGSAYSEFVFTDVFWPDFGPVDLYKAVVEYSHRDRRFGGVAEERR